MSAPTGQRPHVSGENEGRDLKRLSVKITQEMDRAMNSMVERKGISKAEALRRLVLMGNMMAEADANGEEILFKSGEQTSRIRLI